MRLSVLVDNNTIIDRYFLGEPGLSFFIEEGGRRVLFDAGYSDVFLRNAARLGIDLRKVDDIVLSHGHIDHTWGLEPLIRLYLEAAIEGLACSRPRLTAHPEVFASRREGRAAEIGSLLTEEKLSRHFDMNLFRRPFRLTEKLFYLGEIERKFAYEGRKAVGEAALEDGWRPDFLPDDTGLAYVSESGLVVITGCAHAGVCNTVEHARKVTGVEQVAAVIGGFHLLFAPDDVLGPTAEYLAGLELEALYPCHCTDLSAKMALAKALPVKEVGAGLVLEWD